MDKKALGQTDLHLSPIGLGTVKFGRNQGVKYPNGFDIPSEDSLSDLLAQAKELGVNTLDTAPAYGSSEERLGRLLKGQRHDWVIVGKAGEEFENGESSYNFTAAHFERSLERSLKRLQTDYIDIFLIHSDGNDDDIFANDALMTAMHRFKEQGKVRALGVSTKTVSGGVASLTHFDTVMATYNPTYIDEKPVLDFAEQQGKGVLLKKALSSGHNTNIEQIFEFCFDHPATCSAIIGTITPAHLESNVKAFTSRR